MNQTLKSNINPVFLEDIFYFKLKYPWRGKYITMDLKHAFFWAINYEMVNKVHCL